MERHEHVERFLGERRGDDGRMAERPEQAPPSLGGDAVAYTRARRGWTDDRDAHRGKSLSWDP